MKTDGGQERRRWAPPWAHGRHSDRPRRLLHGRVIFASLIFVIEALGVRWAGHNASTVRPLDHIGYALLAAGCAALIWRRRLRVPMLAVTGAANVAYLVMGYPAGPIFLAGIISVIGALRTRHRRGTRLILLASYTTYVSLGHIAPKIGGVAIVSPPLSTAILVAAWIIVTYAVGAAIRNRTEHATEIGRTHAEQQRARDEQRRRQASEERLRIAQELHDVLGHHLSLINVQAGVGLHLMDDDPAQARVSLQTIKLASAEALGEVRAVLGMLRSPDEQAPRAPAPSLANLRTLIGEEHTEIQGAARPLPPDVDRAAFRIVQESLTNVRRHAGDGALASVLIEYRPGGLRLVVSDNGVGPPLASHPGAGRTSAGVGKVAAGVGKVAAGVGKVAAGDALLSPGVTRRLIAEFAAHAPTPNPPRSPDPLTEREREVVALVATGLSNEEIAERLVVSPATAKTHVSRAMGKLVARDRAQLVVYAYESGLVRPGWLGN